jgi:hypothetical protein
VDLPATFRLGAGSVDNGRVRLLRRFDDDSEQPDRAGGPVRRVVKVLGVTAVVVAAALAPVDALPAGADVTAGTRLVMTDVATTVLSRKGDTGRITARVANLSLRPATGVTVRLQLPGGISLDAENAPGCSDSGRLVTCEVGSVAAGDSVPVTIAVRSQGEARTTLAAFLPPRSDQFDPYAGELLMSEWNHEADGQNAPLAQCWPVGVASPMTDIAGGGPPASPACDGVRDAPDLIPDTTAMLTAFPGRYIANVTRSWEWVTVVTPPTTGSYRVCGLGVDDGAYVAIAPAGRPLTASDLVLEVDTYTSKTSEAFPLSAGVEYQVLIRVANRGAIGIDNGGSYPGGWEAFGIAPAGTPCTPADRAVFGVDGWVTTYPVTIEVGNVGDLLIGGAVSGPRDGGTVTAIRVENQGPDQTGGIASFESESGGVPEGATGCVSRMGTSETTCSVGALGDGASTVVSLSASDPLLRGIWSIAATDVIDTDPFNDRTPTI